MVMGILHFFLLKLWLKDYANSIFLSTLCMILWIILRPHITWFCRNYILIAQNNACWGVWFSSSRLFLQRLYLYYMTAHCIELWIVLIYISIVILSIKWRVMCKSVSITLKFYCIQRRGEKEPRSHDRK